VLPMIIIGVRRVAWKSRRRRRRSVPKSEGRRGGKRDELLTFQGPENRKPSGCSPRGQNSQLEAKGASERERRN